MLTVDHHQAYLQPTRVGSFDESHSLLPHDPRTALTRGITCNGRWKWKCASRKGERSDIFSLRIVELVDKIGWPIFTGIRSAICLNFGGKSINKAQGACLRDMETPKRKKPCDDLMILRILFYKVSSTCACRLHPNSIDANENTATGYKLLFLYENDVQCTSQIPRSLFIRNSGGQSAHAVGYYRVCVTLSSGGCLENGS